MQLLVSVTGAAEAVEAVAGGAALIDVKNPAEGALGAAAPAVVQAVRAAVPAHLPVSAALGDFQDQPGTAALAAVGAALAGADLVKIGLLGTGTPAAAHRLLSGVVRSLEQLRFSARLIACAYADAVDIGALPVRDLAAVAAAAGCAGAMVDTFRKSPGTGLLSALGPAALADFVSQCRTHGLLCGLAGSLRAADLAVVAAVAPDYAGVRGAACGGDRSGCVTRAHVQALVQQLERPVRPVYGGQA